MRLWVALPPDSPEAASWPLLHLPSRSRSSSKGLDGPYRLVEPLVIPKPPSASQPREPANPDKPTLALPYLHIPKGPALSPLARPHQSLRHRSCLGRHRPELNTVRSPLHAPPTSPQPPPPPHALKCKAHPPPFPIHHHHHHHPRQNHQWVSRLQLNLHHTTLHHTTSCNAARPPNTTLTLHCSSLPPLPRALDPLHHPQKSL